MAKKISDGTPREKTDIREPKILSQEELVKWWPFCRVDGRSLEKLQKQEVLKHSEESSF
jgi:hypothetical protein